MIDCCDSLVTNVSSIKSATCQHIINHSTTSSLLTFFSLSTIGAHCTIRYNVSKSPVFEGCGYSILINSLLLHNDIFSLTIIIDLILLLLAKILFVFIVAYFDNNNLYFHTYIKEVLTYLSFYIFKFFTPHTVIYFSNGGVQKVTFQSNLTLLHLLPTLIVNIFITHNSNPLGTNYIPSM